MLLTQCEQFSTQQLATVIEGVYFDDVFEMCWFSQTTVRACYQQLLQLGLFYFSLAKIKNDPTFFVDVSSPNLCDKCTPFPINLQTVALQELRVVFSVKSLCMC